MKLLPLLVLFVLLQHLSAQSDLVNYQLPEKHRAMGTKSLKINDSTSLHFAITKNRKTRKVELKPFVITNNTAKSFNSVVFDAKPKNYSNALIGKHHYFTL